MLDSTRNLPRLLSCQVGRMERKQKLRWRLRKSQLEYCSLGLMRLNWSEWWVVWMLGGCWLLERRDSYLPRPYTVYASSYPRCHSVVAAAVPVHATPKLDLLLRVPLSATSFILYNSFINLDHCCTSLVDQVEDRLKYH